jgi:Holliday junction resolvasome RuvABC endonuclease subunit
MDWGDVVAWGVFSTEPGYDEERRVRAICQEVDALLHNTALGVGLVVIEVPVGGKNVSALGKQWRLFQGLETQLRRFGTVCRVNPRTSKKAATGKGNATKDTVYAASPIRDKALTKANHFTLADAWAHAQAGLRGLGTMVPDMAAPVKSKTKRGLGEVVVNERMV